MRNSIKSIAVALAALLLVSSLELVVTPLAADAGLGRQEAGHPGMT